MKTEVRQQEIELDGRQSVAATRIVATEDGTKIRLAVKRDSYDFQSYLRASVWTTESGWEYLTHIPFEDTEAIQLSYVALRQDRAAGARILLRDLDRLEEIAVEVLR